MKRSIILPLALAMTLVATSAVAETAADDWVRSKQLKGKEEFFIGQRTTPPTLEERARYPTAILMIFDYDKTWKRNLPTNEEWEWIDVFERGVREALQRDSMGTLVLSLAAGGQYQWHAFTRDPSEAMRRIVQALPRQGNTPEGRPLFYLQIEHEPDPSWSRLRGYLEGSPPR